ncbi:M48 family metallopeptidase [Pseudomonas baetica]|uniref:M48 family metallopeptidase n=1 Tax=Pseudomonas baetica TaxID=674054 RepID=UPI0028716CA4|nr:SprT family zinc-dependent metalloprotease [Pseudomonas baetica]MDR9860394.1 SprT family zinc-dependent metalloprotease [Pseudomonas baetica]
MSVPILLPEAHGRAAKHWLSFHYADELIVVERAPKARQVPRLLIKVDPDCRVSVQAPDSANDEEVLLALKKRGRWIYQQLRQFRANSAHVTPRKYISGESHYYLGKQHVLKVIEAPADVPQVRLLRGKLEVSVRQKKAETVREHLRAWYRVRARDVFNRRLKAVLEQTLWVVDEPPLRIQTMQTQWGSCSPNGRITLNPHLVKTPRECIDYVILHELCHIAEHNHSERFYRLMKQVMPHWEKVKARLDGMAALVLSDLATVEHK